MREESSQYIPNSKSDRVRFDAIKNRIPSDAGRILDIGCVDHSTRKRSTNNLHGFLHTQFPGVDLLGIDLIKNELEKMRREGFNVREMDAENMTFNEEFDVIVAGEVIEHLANLDDFLKSIENALSDDGICIITTPNPDGFYYWRKALFGQDNNETHTCWIDPTNMKQLVNVSEAKLGIKEISYLPPIGGISKIIWNIGRHRASSAQYICILKKINNT